MTCSEIQFTALNSGFIRYSEECSCHICGKAFWATVEWSWKYNGAKLCSYSCMRKAEKQRVKRREEQIALTGNDPGRKKIVPPEIAAQMREMRAKGTPILTIAKVFGVTDSTVSRHTKGIISREESMSLRTGNGAPLKPDVVAEILKLHRQGLSAYGIEKAIGVSRRAAARYIDRLENETIAVEG